MNRVAPAASDYAYTIGDGGLPPWKRRKGDSSPEPPWPKEPSLREGLPLSKAPAATESSKAPAATESTKAPAASASAASASAASEAPAVRLPTYHVMDNDKLVAVVALAPQKHTILSEALNELYTLHGRWSWADFQYALMEALDESEKDKLDERGLVARLLAVNWDMEEAPWSTLQISDHSVMGIGIGWNQAILKRSAAVALTAASQALKGIEHRSADLTHCAVDLRGSDFMVDKQAPRAPAITEVAAKVATERMGVWQAPRPRDLRPRDPLPPRTFSASSSSAVPSSSSAVPWTLTTPREPLPPPPPVPLAALAPRSSLANSSSAASREPLPPWRAPLAPRSSSARNSRFRGCVHSPTPAPRSSSARNSWFSWSSTARGSTPEFRRRVRLAEAEAPPRSSSASSSTQAFRRRLMLLTREEADTRRHSRPSHRSRTPFRAEARRHSRPSHRASRRRR